MCVQSTQDLQEGLQRSRVHSSVHWPLRRGFGEPGHGDTHHVDLSAKHRPRVLQKSPRKERDRQALSSAGWGLWVAQRVRRTEALVPGREGPGAAGNGLPAVCEDAEKGQRLRRGGSKRGEQLLLHPTGQAPPSQFTRAAELRLSVPGPGGPVQCHPLHSQHAKGLKKVTGHCPL